MIELLTALTVGGFTLVGCRALASKTISRPKLADVSLPRAGGPTDEQMEILANPASPEWSTLDEMQLTRLLRDSTIRGANRESK